MVRKLLLIAASAASLISLAVPARAIDLQPGQWEISTRRERDGVTTPRPVGTMCITPEMAKQMTGQVAKAVPTEFNNAGSSCKTLDLKATDRDVTWRTQCTGVTSAEQNGRYVIADPQHYRSDVHSSVKLALNAVSSTLITEGRRIGECPK